MLPAGRNSASPRRRVTRLSSSEMTIPGSPGYSAARVRTVATSRSNPKDPGSGSAPTNSGNGSSAGEPGQHRHRGDPLDQGRDARPAGDQPLEHLAHAIRALEPVEQIVQRRRVGRVAPHIHVDERLDQLQRLLQRPEPAQRLERRAQRVNELGLRIRVAVVPVRRRHRDAGRVLPLESLLGLLGQSDAPAARADAPRRGSSTERAGDPDRRRGLPRDRRRSRREVGRRADDDRGRPGVRAEPQFRLRAAGGRPSEQLGNGVGEPHAYGRGSLLICTNIRVLHWRGPHRPLKTTYQPGRRQTRSPERNLPFPAKPAGSNNPARPAAGASPVSSVHA